MTNKSEDYIINLYCEENKSTYEIAKDLNTYPNKILRILKKHGVSVKTKSEAQKEDTRIQPRVKPERIERS